jgi:hypothetical protein
MLVADADLTTQRTIEFVNSFETDRVGWREITAVGNRVAIIDTPVATESVTDGLREYPVDLLSSPMDIRAATFQVRPDATETAPVKSLPLLFSVTSLAAPAVTAVVPATVRPPLWVMSPAVVTAKLPLADDAPSTSALASLMVTLRPLVTASVLKSLVAVLSVMSLPLPAASVVAPLMTSAPEV